MRKAHDAGPYGGRLVGGDERFERAASVHQLPLPRRPVEDFLGPMPRLA